MGDEPTPADELEVQADGTPSTLGVEEPAAPLEPEDRPDQSPAPAVIAQAEYTRATQLAAAIRGELGLPKGATQAQVLEALRGARVAPAGDDGEPVEEEDPRVAAANERAFQAQMRVINAVYGDEFSSEALALINAARTSDDIEELMHMAAAFRQGAQPATAPPPAAAEESPAPAAPNIDTSEGDQAPRVPESTPSGRRESGAVGAIRGLFESAGIASRPNRS